MHSLLYILLQHKTSIIYCKISMNIDECINFYSYQNHRLKIHSKIITICDQRFVTGLLKNELRHRNIADISH